MKYLRLLVEYHYRISENEIINIVRKIKKNNKVYVAFFKRKNDYVIIANSKDSEYYVEDITKDIGDEDFELVGSYPYNMKYHSIS